MSVLGAVARELSRGRLADKDVSPSQTHGVWREEHRPSKLWTPLHLILHKDIQVKNVPSHLIQRYCFAVLFSPRNFKLKGSLNLHSHFFLAMGTQGSWWPGGLPKFTQKELESRLKHLGADVLIKDPRAPQPRGWGNQKLECHSTGACPVWNMHSSAVIWGCQCLSTLQGVLEH